MPGRTDPWPWCVTDGWSAGLPVDGLSVCLSQVLGFLLSVPVVASAVPATTRVAALQAWLALGALPWLKLAPRLADLGTLAYQACCTTTTTTEPTGGWVGEQQHHHTGRPPLTRERACLPALLILCMCVCWGACGRRAGVWCGAAERAAGHPPHARLRQVPPTTYHAPWAHRPRSHHSSCGVLAGWLWVVWVDVSGWSSRCAASFWRLGPGCCA